MISLLKGKVIDTNKTDITLLTNDSVGYKVNIASNLKFLIEEEVQLFIYTSVKETEISLWGFLTKTDLTLFEYLISVSGVGSKTAMILIDTKGFENIIRAVANEDYSALKVSGVGPKTAQRIVIELKTKLAKFSEGLMDNINTGANSNRKVNPHFDDALEALTSLGYREQDVKEAYQNLEDSELELAINSPTLVKLLLKVI